MDPASITTLQTLLEQAERERDAAQLALRQAEDGERRAADQADQLDNFRRDYLSRWGAQPGRAGTVTLLQCYHGFMERLNQAQSQQQRQCEASRQRTAQAREALRSRELRVAAVRKLIERRQSAAHAVAERREQKRNDEAAQRLAWAARHAPDLH